MSWESVASASGGSFLKLEPNVTHHVWFVGEPDIKNEHWSEAQNRSVDCTGVGCVECGRGDKPNRRFRFPVRTKDGQDAIVIGSFKLGNAVIAARNAIGPEKFPAQAFTLTRTGMGKSTDYRVQIAVGGGGPPAKKDDIPF